MNVNAPLRYCTGCKRWLAQVEFCGACKRYTLSLAELDESDFSDEEQEALKGEMGVVWRSEE